MTYYEKGAAAAAARYNVKAAPLGGPANSPQNNVANAAAGQQLQETLTHSQRLVNPTSPIQKIAERMISPRDVNTNISNAFDRLGSMKPTDIYVENLGNAFTNPGW